MKLKQKIEKNPNLDIAKQNFLKIKSGKPAEYICFLKRERSSEMDSRCPSCDNRKKTMVGTHTCSPSTKNLLPRTLNLPLTLIFQQQE